MKGKPKSKTKAKRNEKTNKERNRFQRHLKTRKKKLSEVQRYINDLKRNLPPEDELDQTSPQEPKVEVVRTKESEKKDLCRSLFVQNIPLAAGEEQLKERFQAFGNVRRILLMNNKVSGSFNGTCFVHYYDPAAVKSALEEGQKNVQELMTIDNKPDSKRKFKKESQVKDINISTMPFIWWQGWRLIVSETLSREEIKKKKEESLKKKAEDINKSRNIYLAKEGVITRNSRAAAGLPERILNELDDRYKLKMKKLRSNTNFFISNTRLCVHNIPSNIDSKELRSIFLKTVKEHIAQHGDPVGFEWDTRPVDKCGRRKGPDPTIKQAKIVGDPNKRDETSTLYGYVEFKHHEHALIALRGINNNPTIFGPKKRLYVEFSLEDAQKVRLQKLKKERKKDGTTFERKRKEKKDFKSYNKQRKKESKKKQKPAYMKSQAYQDMITRWLRQKKQTKSKKNTQ